jgi:hypothetical protein
MTFEELAQAREGSPLGALPLSAPLPEEFRLVGEDYVLLERLGEGGMGEVWWARQLSTGREVAVKLLRRGHSDARFAQEVAALAKLEHPGIVKLFQAGQHEGRPFLVLELIAGPTVAQLLQAGPLEPRMAAQAVKEAAEALAAGHSQGLIHRDLKPSNLLRDAAGRVRVTDFGLAKDLTAGRDLTLTGEQLGTPAYMAPEQVDSRRGVVGSAADVYGLGATLFHTLTGRPPFDGATTAEILHHVMTREPDWHTGWERVHRDLRTICQRAMHREPGRRYPGAAELAAELGRFLAGEPIHARPMSLAERAWRTARKPWPVAVAAASVLGSLLAALLLPVLNRSQTRALVSGWPRANPTALHVLNTPSRAGSGRLVSFSDVKGLMAIGGSERRVRIAALDPWRPLTGSLLLSNRVSFHVFQPGEPILLAVEESGRWKIALVDPIYREGISDQMSTNVTRVAYSREGHHWALGSAAGEVDVRAFTERQFRRPFQTRHDGAVTALQFDETASRLLTASADRTVRLWDLATQQPLQTWSADARFVVAGFAAGDSLVYAAHVRSRRSSVTRLFRTADGSSVATNHFSGELTGLQLSPDGSRLIALSSERWAEIWDVRDLTVIAKTSEHPEPLTTASVSADGLRLLTVDASGSARLWDAHTGEPLSDFWRGPAGIRHAAFAPDGIRIGSGDVGPTGTLWDASCPLPVGWDREALLRALLRDGRLPSLRRAAWLAPENADVLNRLATATAVDEPQPRGQPEADFLRQRAARLSSR